MCRRAPPQSAPAPSLDGSGPPVGPASGSNGLVHVTSGAAATPAKDVVAMPKSPGGKASSGLSGISRWPADVPKRYLLATCTFFGLFLVYTLRVILSVAVVPIAHEHNWSEPMRGFALSAFFIGYIMLQIPGGWLCLRFGGKLVFGLGVLVPALITMVTPLLVSCYPAFIVARILTGVGESVTYPAVHALLGRWAPSSERSRMVGLIWSGAYLGTTFAFPVSGLIINMGGAFGGWPPVFYYAGALGIVWWLVWAYVTAATPALHRSISAEERSFIEDSIELEERTDVPWRFFFSSSEVWAVILSHTSHNWLFYTLLTWLPSYLNGQLHFDIKKAGLVSVLPYFCCFALSNVGGQTADWFLRRGSRLAYVRQAAQAVGEGLPTMCMVAINFVDSTPLAVILITAAVGISGVSGAGYGSRHLDLAPEYSGILMGMTNTAATVPGIISPWLTGLILGHDPDKQRWMIVFFIAAAVTVVGLITWLVWVRVDRLRLPEDSSLLGTRYGASPLGVSTTSGGSDSERAPLVTEGSEGPRWWHGTSDDYAAPTWQVPTSEGSFLGVGASATPFGAEQPHMHSGGRGSRGSTGRALARAAAVSRPGLPRKGQDRGIIQDDDEWRREQLRASGRLRPKGIHNEYNDSYAPDSGSSSDDDDMRRLASDDP